MARGGLGFRSLGVLGLGILANRGGLLLVFTAESGWGY